MQENETTKQDETETQETDTIKKGFSHTVRHKDGKTVTIKNYSMKKAIALNCSECEGFESDPRNCVDKLCPLWPFRDYTLKNRNRAEYKFTPEQKQKALENLKKGHKQKDSAKSDI